MGLGTTCGKNVKTASINKNEVTDSINPFKPSGVKWLHFKSVEGHTGLNQALWHSVLSARVSECQKNWKGGLDQYGAERFGRLIFKCVTNVSMPLVQSCGHKIKQHQNTTQDMYTIAQDASCDAEKGVE